MSYVILVRNPTTRDVIGLESDREGEDAPLREYNTHDEADEAARKLFAVKSGWSYIVAEAP